ncbi:MAG: hypothetical protein JWP81_274 [Ferruginibacter sp.]|nr:hypothetical protein [Ferruginibacter sp.]
MILTTRLSFFLLAVSVCCSCNNQTGEPKTQPGKASAFNCYNYINKKDTVILKTILVGGFITGTLVYNFYEKDKSQGTIQGQMKGDLLIADYTFNSEGIQSKRQIAFKKMGDKFIEGYGEAEDRNGKMAFKNLDSLNFDHTTILNKVDCK